MKNSVMRILIMLTILLTACNSDTTCFNTGLEEHIETTKTLQEQPVHETSMHESTAEIINTAVDQENTDITEVKDEIYNPSIVAPDSDFLLKMLDVWCSNEVLENGKELCYYGMEGSPIGSSHVFYTDIDGDSIKELCFIVDSFHGDCMYVCKFTSDNWKIVDALALGHYTYLQMNENGTTSLFVVNGTRFVEGLYCYVYNKGIEKEFELLDNEKMNKEVLKTTDIYEQDKIYYAAIEDALKKYDNLTNFYDLPHVDTMLLYEVHALIHENYRWEDFDEGDVKRQLDEFTAEVSELFR